MATLVVGHSLTFFRGEVGIAFFTEDDPVSGQLKAVGGDFVQVFPGCGQGGLIDQVFQVGAGEANGARCDLFQVDIVRQGHLAHVYFQNGGAGFFVGAVQGDLAVESAGSEQGAIQYIGPVGGGQNQDVLVGFEAVHLGENLV